MTLFIKPLTTLEEFEACLSVQKETWRFDDIDTVPVNIIRVFADKTDPWGIVLGAFDGNKLVGFTLCLPTSHPATYLAHMLAVIPSYQEKGVGGLLAQAATQVCLDRGVKKVVATFDPLESRNAHIYIKRMGAIGKSYVRNYYSHLTCALENELPTDRLKIEFFLDPSVDTYSSLRQTKDPLACIEIPDNITSIKEIDKKAALELRLRTRQEFEDLMKKGFVVVGFDHEPKNQKGRYWLVRDTTVQTPPTPSSARGLIRPSA